VTRSHVVFAGACFCWCLAEDLAGGDQHRGTGSGNTLEACSGRCTIQIHVYFLRTYTPVSQSSEIWHLLCSWDVIVGLMVKKVSCHCFGVIVLTTLIRKWSGWQESFSMMSCETFGQPILPDSW